MLYGLLDIGQKLNNNKAVSGFENWHTLSLHIQDLISKRAKQSV